MKILSNDIQKSLIIKGINLLNDVFCFETDTLIELLKTYHPDTDLRESIVLIRYANNLAIKKSPKNIELKGLRLDTLALSKKIEDCDFENFSDSELQVISSAMEFVSRLGMGQLNYMRDIYFNFDHFKSHDFCEICEIFDQAGRLIKCTYGINHQNINYDCSVSWDIYQVIRNYLAWKREPKGNFANVNFDKPMLTSNESLIELSD